MAVRKLSSTDGFVVHDYPDAPSSGLVRMGRKILQRSSTDLARSATYAFAFHRINRGGASAGLNAEGDATGPAIEALLAELSDPLNDDRLELHPGKGVTASVLSADDAANNQLLGSGAVASARWALGGELDGASFALEGFSTDNPSAVAVAQAFEDAGARQLKADPGAKPWEIWGSDVDMLLTGSKPGAMNHQGAEMVKAKAIVPWGPIPITTKALAVMLSKEITYIPDFVSASGPLVAHHLVANGQSPEQALASGIADGLDRAAQTTDESLFVACCLDAEAFLDDWQDHRPFGRPLAG